MRQAREAGVKIDAQAVAAAAQAASASSQVHGLASVDYPNMRVGRIFTQHLPYKSIVSTFAYAVPKAGPQAKYGLFAKTGPVPVERTVGRDRERGAGRDRGERGEKGERQAPDATQSRR